jgi:hypothetical protein
MIVEEAHCPVCYAGLESLETTDVPPRLPDGWDLEVLKCNECGAVFSCAPKTKIENA